MKSQHLRFLNRKSTKILIHYKCGPKNPNLLNKSSKMYKKLTSNLTITQGNFTQKPHPIYCLCRAKKIKKNSFIYLLSGCRDLLNAKSLHKT